MRGVNTGGLSDDDGMWILTPEGFFSIVQKPGEEQLSVRARDPATWTGCGRSSCRR
jgi:hypothetical protein